MERLTKSDLNKVCYDPWKLCGMDQYCSKGVQDEGGCANGCHILKMYKKLAEYEDTEEHGLLLRLPCKVGDTVYVIANCGHVNKKLDGTLYDLNGGYGTATGYYCPYEDCCPQDCDEFTCCEDYAEKEAIFEDIVLSICLEKTGLTVFTENLGVCGYVGENFIFLTREQAEKKLKELQKDGETHG